MSILRQVWTEEEMAERNQFIGREMGREEAAYEMKADGLSIEKIMQYTKLSREVIEAL